MLGFQFQLQESVWEWTLCFERVSILLFGPPLGELAELNGENHSRTGRASVFPL